MCVRVCVCVRVRVCGVVCTIKRTVWLKLCIHVHVHATCIFEIYSTVCAHS